MRHVTEADAWSYVAGLTVRQDLSERTVQLEGSAAQYSLGKSFPGFAPTGPVLVPPDEVLDLDDIELACELNGETVQHSSTRHLIFGIPELIARLSAVLPLLPGDLVFTGRRPASGSPGRPRGTSRRGRPGEHRDRNRPHQDHCGVLTCSDLLLPMPGAPSGRPAFGVVDTTYDAGVGAPPAARPDRDLLCAESSRSTEPADHA